MLSLSRALAFGVVVAFGVACATEPTSVTTITSAPESPLAEPRGPSEWVTYEVCKRRASCLEEGPGGSSVGAVPSAACVEAVRPRVVAMLAKWDACSPAAQRARLEECLPAIRVARCEPLLTGQSSLPLCPGNDECPR